LSIGDELMYGEILDSNFAHIAARLYAEGLPVARHLSVGDGEAAIAAALRLCAVDFDAVIATGGLGPTSDDRTAAAAAAAAGLPLRLDAEALAHIRRVAGRLGGDIPPANEKQALVPATATLIPNPTGTACGFHILLGDCRLYFLPGVPREMTQMLEETVLPALLAARTEEEHCFTKVLTVFGPSEAELGTILDEAVPAATGVEVAYCVAFPEIQVKLRATGKDATLVADRLTAATAAARTRIGQWITAEDDESIDTVVARLLREKGLTLSLAESCTGGLVAKRITDSPGSSAYFLEGAVTYSNAAKERLLGVPSRLLAEHGAVSTEVARAMAQGSRAAAGSELALAITGIAGPDGGTPEKPAGTVFIALARTAGTDVRRYFFNGSREEVRSITAVTALDWLRRELLSR
ncbi:MAG TPA: competence/damage-inducible protein A, partial [Geobacteraceae bacterium]